MEPYVTASLHRRLDDIHGLIIFGSFETVLIVSKVSRAKAEWLVQDCLRMFADGDYMKFYTQRELIIEFWALVQEQL